MAYNSYRPSQSSTPVVLNLIIINVIVFVAQLVFKDLTNYLALYSYDTGLFNPYQLVTHMFAHSPNNYFHIIFNMYALWLFGSALERLWGGKRFLIFYFICGIAAGLTQMFLVRQGAAIGASGAIMGLLAAFAYTFPNIQFYILPIPFPIKAKYLAIIYAAIDIFGEFSGGGNVAHFAHLGGLVMGLILCIIWKKRGKSNY
ncbi:MAG TPA: rhomboid family intramembrane serine protease [Hanamia sp.]|jgi:membrane associated rhomboid family serine protease|nr:rhomboid family intramembrane serine protease [Hanamia sp.]